jgi:hypothetical protein
MNQTSLNRAVARATGETVERIERMGFHLMIMPRVYRPQRSSDEIVAQIVAGSRARQARSRQPVQQLAA